MLQSEYVVNLSFLKKQEKFFILRIGSETTTGFLLGVDAEKHLTPLGFWEGIALPDFFSLRSGSVRDRIAKISWKTWRVIVAVEPRSAFVARVPATLKRGDSGAPLTQPEFEDFLGKTASQIFNHCRSSASRGLQTSEAETVLIDSRVGGFRVDGHEVLDPLGFRAKEIYVDIELIFTTRDLHEQLRFLFQASRRFFFTDLVRAQIASISQFHVSPCALLLLGEHASFWFDGAASSRESGMSVKNLSWSSRSYFDTICAQWGVGRNIAEQIYHAHLKREFSPGAHRALDKALGEVSNSLFAQLARNRLKGMAFLNTAHPLPFSLPYRRSGVRLEWPPLDGLLENSGFAINAAEWGIPPYLIFERLAPFLELYYDKNDHKANHWLKRRLHWLGALVG